MVNKREMLKILNETEFPINTGRTNILKKGQTHSKSMVLGKVHQMFKGCDGKKCKVDSQNNKKYKELLKATKSFLRDSGVKYRFESVTINKNHAAAKHVDQNNQGHSYIIGLGNYTGGELVFTNKASATHGTHNIKNKWLKFTGDTEHYVKPFKGLRYTIVYYHLTGNALRK